MISRMVAPSRIDTLILVVIMIVVVAMAVKTFQQAQSSPLTVERLLRKKTRLLALLFVLPMVDRSVVFERTSMGRGGGGVRTGN